MSNQGTLSGIERTIPKKAWMKDYTFVLVQRIEELEEIINKAIAKGLCAFDLESTGLDTRVFNGVCNSKVVGYSLAFEPKKCYYIPIRHTTVTDRGDNLDVSKTNALIQRLLNECVIVGHNWLKFDIEMMFASEGIDLVKVAPGKPYPYHDTYVLARLAGMNPAGLKYLSKKLLDKEMIEITEVVLGKKEIDFGGISPYEGCLYAASDAICTLELWEHPEIQKPIKEQSFIYTIERKLLPVVRRMERNKIKLDLEHCKRLDKELVEKMEQIEKDIYAMVSEKTNGTIQSFKIDSPADVSHILFDVYDMNPKPEQGKNGNYKTDDETLEKLAPEYPLAKLLQDYRTTTKFYRTYIKNMLINVDKEGYLKFNFSPLRTDSGRFASPGKSDAGETTDGYSGVNIQAVPARYDKTKPNVRKCISCEEDEVIVAMDWAGVEIRVAANMSLEPIWLDRFLNGDGDLHTSTASIIYDIPENAVEKQQRQIGKCVDPDSILYVNGEYRRIGSLHGSRENDTFYSIEDKNLKVKISEKDTAPIKNFYSNGKAPRYLVCFRRGILVCSENHRVELEDGSLVRSVDLVKGQILKEIEYGVTSEKEISEISINPFLKSSSENNIFFGKINDDLSYFLGLFVGDGGCSKNSANIHTGVGGKYDLWAQHIKNSLLKIGLNPNINKEQTNNKGYKNRKVYFGSRHTLAILQQFQVVGDNFKKSLKVPDYLFNASESAKLSFLGGLIDTVGSVSKKNGNIDFTTKSWTLAQDACVLLASINLHYSVEPTYNKKYKRYYFRVRISKSGNSKIKPFIKCPWKLERITEPSFKYTVYPKNEIISVIPLDSGNIVDIEVDHPDHMYVVNNIRTHNTFNFQSIYGGGPGALASTLNLTIDDAKEKQERFFGRLVKLQKWIKSLQYTAKQKGYCLTQFGRKRMLPEFESDIPRVQANAKRKSVNTPVQGSAADLMKIAMILLDNYIEENSLRDKVQLLLTMHDELVFRIKKTHIDIIPELERVMRLEDTLKRINWKVPLAVDVEVGPSWDIHYEYKQMVEFLTEKYNTNKVAYIYESGKNYSEFLDGCKAYLEEKKKNKKEKEEKSENTLDKESLKKDEFKKLAFEAIKNNSIENYKEESEELLVEDSSESTTTPFSTENIVSVEKSSVEEITSDDSFSSSGSVLDLDKYFSIMKSASLSDLPEEAHIKLKKSFYEKEVERILSGTSSEEDADIEIPIIVHDPIDSSKKNLIGYIIDSCPGRGRVKFLTEKKEELHKDWVEVDILKASVMSKIFNL